MDISCDPVTFEFDTVSMKVDEGMVDTPPEGWRFVYVDEVLKNENMKK